jgi:hypothetical protein
MHSRIIRSLLLACMYGLGTQAVFAVWAQAAPHSVRGRADRRPISPYARARLALEWRYPASQYQACESPYVPRWLPHVGRRSVPVQLEVGQTCGWNCEGRRARAVTGCQYCKCANFRHFSWAIHLQRYCRRNPSAHWAVDAYQHAHINGGHAADAYPNSISVR